MTAVRYHACDDATATWLARYDDVVAPVLPTYFDVVAHRGEGSWLVDVDGRRFLDLGSGIAVTSTGHCHPRVVAAIDAQARMLVHTSVVTRHERQIELAERLGVLCPFFERPQVFFCNSGAEAVDGVLKLARKVIGRPGVVAFEGGFHGRTLAATTLTATKPAYRDGYEPLLPGVEHAPYCRDASDVQPALRRLDDVLTSSVGAVIVEPVLGEGGYVVPPVEWLRGIRDRCTQMSALLVFDEVQCGIGRTGHPFAAETFGVVPDVLLFAKGVASGLPLGGIIAPRPVMQAWPRGAHGSTFGGNPVACAAALATLDVLEREGCYDRARILGAHALDRLSPLRSVEVRGIGLMIGVRLADKSSALEVQRRCFDDGVLVLTCGPAEDTLRLAPALTISPTEWDHGLDVLIKAIGSLHRTASGSARSRKAARST
jgi:4-aminobutyrate aminotransferase